MDRNYYVVLGVAPDATTAQIKDAWRRRAMECHPDRTGTDGGRFQELQQAYETLADPASRRDYDRRVRGHGRIPVRPQRGGARRTHRTASGWSPHPPPAEPFGDPFRAAAEPFADPAFAPRSAAAGRFGGAGARAGDDDLLVEVPLSLGEARRGGRLQVHLQAQAICPWCSGTGAVRRFACRHCAGSGTVTADVPVVIAWPAGVRHGERIACTLDWGGGRPRRLTVLFRVPGGPGA